jgi:hypothetical protein
MDNKVDVGGMDLLHPDQGKEDMGEGKDNLEAVHPHRLHRLVQDMVDNHHQVLVGIRRTLCNLHLVVVLGSGTQVDMEIAAPCKRQAYKEKYLFSL